MILPEGTNLGSASASDGSTRAASHLARDSWDFSAEHFRILDAAYEEFCRLQKKGQVVEPAEFCARFPAVQSSLGKLLRCHRYLEELPEEEPDWPQPGQELAGFKLLRELGKGTFSRVYQATEAALGDRLVALKISTAGDAEAATLGPLDHPGIVCAYSVRQDEATGLWAICMPYRGSATLHHVLDRLDVLRRAGQKIQGRHLLEACRDPFAPQPEAANEAKRRDGAFSEALQDLALGLLQALAFIHERGIQHRDLKPSNVLLRGDGAPLLIDFNLSTDPGQPERLRGGTPLYMAPEQLEAGLRSSAAALDHRADLFSLGIILYELASGAHPFGPFPFRISTAELAATLLQRQRHGCTPVRQACPELETNLAGVIDQCLAHDPAKRPASAADALWRLQRPMPWPRRAVRFLARRPGTVLAALLLAAAVGVALAAQLREAATRNLFQASQAAFHEGDFQQARQALSQVLGHQPANADALLLRGQVYLKLGDPYSANADFLLADRLKPDGLSRTWRGYCFQQLNESRAASIFYKAAQEKGASSLPLLNNLGAAYLDINEPDLAEDVLREALKIGFQVQSVHHNLALACMKKGVRDEGDAPQYFAEAVQHAEIALKAGPISTELLFDCACIHGLAARYDRAMAAPALDLLEQALRRGHDPTHLARLGFFAAIQAEVAALIQRPVPVEASASRAHRLLEPLARR